MAAAICAAIAVPAMAQTNYPGGGAAIPNQGAATVFPIQFFVGDTGFITDLNFSILGLTHTFAADLEIALVAPNGTNALLLLDAGNQANFLATDLVFDQQAAGTLVASDDTSFNYPSQTIRPTVVGNVVNDRNGPFPFTPSLTNTLSTFNGMAANGIWSLYVRDDGAGDFGSFTGSSLQVTTAVAAAAPEPASWTLMIGGFAVAGGALRRRRRPVLATA